jgi:hypothetical protein
MQEMHDVLATKIEVVGVVEVDRFAEWLDH